MRCRIAIKIEKGLIGKSVVIFAVVLIIAFILEIRESYENNNIIRIKRNGYGKGTRKETVFMEIEGEKKELVDLSISPRNYSEEEMQQLFSEAMTELENKVLGNNASAEYVTYNLDFMKELPQFPFTIRWKLSRYDIVDMDGKLQKECIRAEDPDKKGIMLTATAILQYEEREASCQKEFMIFSEDSEKVHLRDKILDQIVEEDILTREQGFLRLPEQVDNRRIVWRRQKQSQTGALICLGALISILMMAVEKQKKEKVIQERRKQMLFDYPEIISQIIILMSSGMTMKKVWKKIVEDYQKQKERTGRVRWAYEEMVYTVQEMQTGVSELQCYENFARRCDLLPYMKLGALIAQNLRKGTKGIWGQLEVESLAAMEERKNQIKKLGEEAGTKLLLPMLLMLLIVLAIVVVPAFLSIRI